MDSDQWVLGRESSIMSRITRNGVLILILVVVAASVAFAGIGQAYAAVSPPRAVVSVRGATVARMIGTGNVSARFGCSLAATDNIAVVGAGSDDTGRGSATIFSRQRQRWVVATRLVASDRSAFDRFGSAVAIYGDTAVVGAFGDDAGKGAAYVFTRVSGRWAQRAKLVAPDGLGGDRFGTAVGVSAGTIVVGAEDSAAGRGAAYVFVGSGTSWTLQSKLLPSSLAEESFGSALAFSSNTVVIGAPDAVAQDGNPSGVAYVFTRSQSRWALRTRLTPETGQEADGFGSAIALSAGTAVVGAGSSATGRGSAYVFTRTGADWSQQAVLVPPGVAKPVEFGSSVAVLGDRVLVGAPAAASAAGPASGLTYRFDRQGAAWIASASYAAPHASARDRFGSAVAMPTGTALIGATACDYRRGSAYESPMR